MICVIINSGGKYMSYTRYNNEIVKIIKKVHKEQSKQDNDNKKREISQNRIIRLCPCSFLNQTLENEKKVIHSYSLSSPLLLPESLSLRDTCEIISYLSDRFADEFLILKPSDKEICAIIQKLTDFFGFKKLNPDEFDYQEGSFKEDIVYSDNEDKQISSGIIKKEGITDIFIVTGDLELFAKSDASNRYFNWYIPEITKERFQELLSKIIQNEEKSL